MGYRNKLTCIQSFSLSCDNMLFCTVSFADPAYPLSSLQPVNMFTHYKLTISVCSAQQIENKQVFVYLKHKIHAQA